VSAGVAQRGAVVALVLNGVQPMTTAMAGDWTYDIDRGPDWLYIRVHGPENGDSTGTPVAETIWNLLQQHFARRVVLDLSDLRILRSSMIGQLVQLHKRIASHDGLMRLAGLSDDNYRSLMACRLHDRFPQYATTTDAVMGHRPSQPR
jgi:anti-anti-sigma factor